MRRSRAALIAMAAVSVFAFHGIVPAEEIRMEKVSPEEMEMDEDEEGMAEVDFSRIDLGEDETEGPGPEEESEEEIEVEEVKIGFDQALFDYMKDNGNEKENFMVSPLSLKAALCLAASGAEGETLDQILAAMQYESPEEMNEWFESVNSATESFARWCEDQEGHAFSVVNSVWNNTDVYGSFLEDYKVYVREHYGADAYEESRDKITDAVNSWCSEKTDGLIGKISDDLSKAASVLINALYLKSSWTAAFSEYTWQDVFTDIDGSKAVKDFMNRTEWTNYYEDSDTKLVVLELNGDKQLVVVLGDTDDIEDKIGKASGQMVCVTMPKFEVESTFSGEALIGFLEQEGMKQAFTAEADFSRMAEADAQWYINDIIQKTKLKVDENGLEAAAVTAIVLECGSAAPQEEPEIIDFTANRPFTFYIYSGLYSDAPLQLFAGQYVK